MNAYLYPSEHVVLVVKSITFLLSFFTVAHCRCKTNTFYDSARCLHSFSSRNSKLTRILADPDDEQTVREKFFNLFPIYSITIWENTSELICIVISDTDNYADR